MTIKFYYFLQFTLFYDVIVFLFQIIFIELIKKKIIK